MTPIEQQIQVLQSCFPTTTSQPLGSGAYLIVIDQVELPNGWTKSSVKVKFIAPVGYPLARPDCFWADSDLRLASGAMPKNTAINQIPQIGGQHLWFSWHVASWNPNSDSLLTYLYVIKRRLQDPQ